MTDQTCPAHGEMVKRLDERLDDFKRAQDEIFERLRSIEMTVARWLGIIAGILIVFQALPWVVRLYLWAEKAAVIKP